MSDVKRREFLTTMAAAAAAATTYGQASRLFGADTSPTDKGGGPASPTAGSSWKVGFAQADVTPEKGMTIMTGFGSKRYSEGTQTPLRAQVMVFQDPAGKRALLCTVDVLGFGPESIQVLRHKLKVAHGLAPEAVCFAASHTHWGPAINLRINFLLGPPDVWYLASLEATILRLANEAVRDLAPATAEYGDCEVQLGMNRRFPDGKGEMLWKPYPDGSYDRHTPVLRFVRQKSPKQLIVVGHACHPTSTSGTKWSADYPGMMRDRLEAKLDDCKAMFVMGCGGDAKVIAKDTKTGKVKFASAVEECKAAGEKLADSVIQRIGEKMLPLPAKLHTASVHGSLSFDTPPTREKILDMALNGRTGDYTMHWARQSLAYPDTRTALDYEVQVWRLGPLALVALQGEVCADWGGMIRGMAPKEPVMVVAYANHCPCYIPTARIIREGGYEGDTNHMAYFAPARFQQKSEAELSELVRRALASRD